jgi:hypothetical protein
MRTIISAGINERTEHNSLLKKIGKALLSELHLEAPMP